MIDPELIKEIKGHKHALLSAKFSPDGENLIAAGVENVIYFHKLNQPSYHYKIFAHDDIVSSLDYSEFTSTNVPFFLSASRDRTVKLWINPMGSELTSQEFEPITYRCHNNTIRFVNICPLNSSKFCTGSDDKTVKVWSASVPNKCLNTFSNHTNWIRCCKFSRRSSDLIASCGDDSSLRLFDIRIDGKKGTILKTITTARNRHFTYLDWFPLSEYFIAVSSSNNMIRLFDLRNTAKIIQFYKPFNDSVNSLEFHPSGHYLLACSSDATSKLINVVEGRLVYTLKGHYKSIFNCAFNEQGTRFVTCGKDRAIKLWKLNLKTEASDNVSSDCESVIRRDKLNCSSNDKYSEIFQNLIATTKHLSHQPMQSSIECSINNPDMNSSLLHKSETDDRPVHCSSHLNAFSSNQLPIQSTHRHRFKRHNSVDYSTMNKETSLMDLGLISRVINQQSSSKRTISNQMSRRHYDKFTQSELNEMFSQLNLLEHSLFKLERRLTNLESRLEGM